MGSIGPLLGKLLHRRYLEKSHMTSMQQASIEMFLHYPTPCCPKCVEKLLHDWRLLNSGSAMTNSARHAIARPCQVVSFCTAPRWGSHSSTWHATVLAVYQYRPKNTTILILGTPQKGTLTSWLCNSMPYTAKPLQSNS